MADPILKKGSKGEAVKKAQRALIDRYYLAAGEDDGLFGPITDLAVRNYQHHRSLGQYYAFSFPLQIDGVIGPRTWARLAPPTIQLGSKGDAVKLLQEILTDFGYAPYDPGPIDSEFGPLTETAVKNFQTDYGLTVDGIVGPKTWAALWS
jgi:peptidoglycan hydrolase-like protein with peptidoglycan-binding domain